MIRIPCRFGGPDHEYPDDWIFGGADGRHPGADPRHRPTTYQYYNDKAFIIWSTSVPLCDDEAVDYFTFVAKQGLVTINPVWVSALRTLEDGSTTLEMLPWTYDKATDTATEREK